MNTGNSMTPRGAFHDNRVFRIPLWAYALLSVAVTGQTEPVRAPAGPPVFRSGVIRVWGENHTNPEPKDNWGRDPQVQSAPETSADLAFGGSECLAMLDDGSCRFWGNPHTWHPEQQKFRGAPALEEISDAVSIAAGDSHFLLARKTGTVLAWGDNSQGQCQVPDGLAEVTSVAAGKWHSLALKKDGTVVAWGDNRLGQCQVPEGLAKVKRIRAGWFHSIALLEDGSLRAWGFNYDHQTEIPRNLPPVKDVRAGAAHTIALLENGDVRVWGSDACGLVSTGNKLQGVRQIASGDYHCVALDAIGLRLWGQNGFGQTGRPALDGEVVAVFAGGNTTGVTHADPKPPDFP